MCCGNKRTQLRSGYATHYAPSVLNTPPFPSVVSFQYVGQTRLTVVGPITQTQYNFDQPGARVQVDSRDRILLASLRDLKQVP